MTNFFREFPIHSVVFLCSPTLWLCAGSMAMSQPGPAFLISGEVRTNTAGSWNDSTVTVESVPGGTYAARSFLRPDGSFELNGTPPGMYLVSLRDARGDVIWHDVVTIAPGSGRLVIELDDRVQKPTRAETVSIARLVRKYPAAAVRELRLADRASQHNKLEDANAHLRRAIGLAPDMQDAHNNLGVNYLQSGDYEAARRELEAAVRLDPESPVPQLNLSLALLALNRVPEAGDQARAALRRDPLSARANFAMGAVLERLGKGSEALPYLERASMEVPQSLLTEARIFVARSDTTAAISRLREYLSRPRVPQKAEAQQWMDALTSSASARQ